MTKLGLWSSLLIVAGCSSSTTIQNRGSSDSGAQGGSGGTSSGGTAGGSATGGSAGTSGGSAGTNGAGGSAGAAGSAGSGQSGSAGAAGAAGTGGTSDGGGSGGSAGAGGACSPTNVTVDFTAQGNVRRDKFDQAGVSIVGSSDLQFSDSGSTQSPTPGLGVVGGLYSWSIDGQEFISITFTPRAATNVKYYVASASDVDHDNIFGETTVTGIGEGGQQLPSLNLVDIGSKNISGLTGGVPISRLTIAASGEDGIVLGNLSFSACLQ